MRGMLSILLRVVFSQASLGQVSVVTLSMVFVFRTKVAGCLLGVKGGAKPEMKLTPSDLREHQHAVVMYTWYQVYNNSTATGSGAPTAEHAKNVFTRCGTTRTDQILISLSRYFRGDRSLIQCCRVVPVAVWSACIYHMFPGLHLHYSDPAQHLTKMADTLSTADRDLSDARNLPIGRQPQQQLPTPNTPSAQNLLEGARRSKQNKRHTACCQIETQEVRVLFPRFT